MQITLFLISNGAPAPRRAYKAHHGLLRVPCVGEYVDIGLGAHYPPVVKIHWTLDMNEAEVVLDLVRLAPDELMENALALLRASGWHVFER